MTAVLSDPDLRVGAALIVLSLLVIGRGLVGIAVSEFRLRHPRRNHR